MATLDIRHESAQSAVPQLAITAVVRDTSAASANLRQSPRPATSANKKAIWLVNVPMLTLVPKVAAGARAVVAAVVAATKVAVVWGVKNATNVAKSVTLLATVPKEVAMVVVVAAAVVMAAATAEQAAAVVAVKARLATPVVVMVTWLVIVPRVRSAIIVSWAFR